MWKTPRGAGTRGRRASAASAPAVQMRPQPVEIGVALGHGEHGDAGVAGDDLRAGVALVHRADEDPQNPATGMGTHTDGAPGGRA